MTSIREYIPELQVGYQLVDAHFQKLAIDIQTRRPDLLTSNSDVILFEAWQNTDHRANTIQRFQELVGRASKKDDKEIEDLAIEIAYKEAIRLQNSIPKESRSPSPIKVKWPYTGCCLPGC